MIKVYIASAYVVGDVHDDVRKLCFDCTDELINEGFAPFSPLLFHFQNMIHLQDWETWMMLDMEWLGVCDALLRLPGESIGADQEVEYARDNSIPVFYTINQLIEYYTDEQ